MVICIKVFHWDDLLPDSSESDGALCIVPPVLPEVLPEVPPEELPEEPLEAGGADGAMPGVDGVAPGAVSGLGGVTPGVVLGSAGGDSAGEGLD